MSPPDNTDLGSITWRNPPNRALSVEDSSPSSLTLQCGASKLVHHYPLGIDPNLLNSNPVLAKMLTTGYMGYDAYAAALNPNAMLFASPLLPPVVAAAPIPTHFLTPSGSNTCPSNLLFIVDELRKDPLRRVNPPNKVLLPMTAPPLPNLHEHVGLLHHQTTRTSVLGRDDRLHLPRARQLSSDSPSTPVKKTSDADVYRFTEEKNGAVT